MKHLRLTIIMLTLLFSQLGTVEHAFHEHEAGEVCDYCISAKPFDDAITSSEQVIVSGKQNQNPAILLQVALSKTTRHYYSVRAPPYHI